MQPALLLIVCFFLLGCKNTGTAPIENNLDNNKAIEKACIATVLQKDAELGKIRNHASEQISLSETIDIYTAGLKALDYSKCPTAFTTAFNEHIDAWLAIKPITDKYPEFRGELHELFNRLEKSKDSIEFKLQSKKIWDTWSEIEALSKE
jgi:hypothetical protein